MKTKSNPTNIQIDDIVKLTEESKDYKKWGAYTFRVVGHRFVDGVKMARAVRNFRNESMGSTNHYIYEPYKNMIITRKNPKYKELEKSIEDIQDIEF